MASTKKRFGEVLIDAGLLKEEDLPRVLAEQRGKRERIGETVVRLGLASELEIARALSDQLGIAFVDLSAVAVSPHALQEVPERLARKHLILPVAVLQKELHLAMADPLKFEALQDVRFTSNCTVVPLLATTTDLKNAINQHYQKGTDAIDTLMKDMAEDRPIEVLQDGGDYDPRDAEDLRRRSEAAPIVRMVNLIISQAVETGASDIHIEPGKATLLIRNRVDGLLRQSLEAPKWVQGPVVSRIKVMAKLDIAEKRMPQDGRISIKMGTKSLDLRVSTIPSAHGEKIVIRVLDSTSVTLPLESMGVDPDELAQIQDLIRRPQGIVLVTGPTGAGKTSTLYGMLNSVHSIERNVTTIEDPIEYELGGINQTAVQEKIGLTFAAMLRALLRQDPDVIMLGEMRDAETTNIAIQASITGHLVLSTMHTGNAVATVTRLRNVGVPSYIIASAVNGILAQRLVRRICGNCRKPATPNESELARLSKFMNVAKLKCFVGAGCGVCNGTGYKGRTAVFEILTFTPAIREMVAADAQELDIRKKALSQGMNTLLLAALKKVDAGMTTLAELFRVIEIDEGAVMDCPSCGAATEPDFLACPACARRLSSTCPSCDRKVLETWKVCPYCCDHLQAMPDKPAATVRPTGPRALKSPAPTRSVEEPALTGAR